MKKKEILKIIVTFIMLVAGMLVSYDVIDLSFVFSETGTFTENNVMLIWYLLAYMIVGAKVLKDAAQNILSGQVFDENFLMAIASIGAFFVGEYPEALAVMVFYQIGEFFQDYAVNKSRKSISDLMDIKPDAAYVKQNDGKIVKVHPEEVRIGQIIVVKAGEKVPLDGKVAKGYGTLDTSALTGESLPVEVSEGASVISGSISVNGVLEIEVEKEYGQSTVAKILELVENAGHKKANTEKFITKFARYYTPIVVVTAAVIAVIFPVVEGIISQSGINGVLFSKWIYRALSFLVTSCPCALVISVPLSFFGGIGAASSKGILVKGSNYLENLAKCETIVFDKTGTLTKGVFLVQKIVPSAMNEKEVLFNAITAEFYSNHPISKSLKEAANARYEGLWKKAEDMLADDNIRKKYEEIAGFGIKACVDEKIILAGNKKLMDRENIECGELSDEGTHVYISVDGKYAGGIVIADEIKESSPQAILELKKTGVKKTVMLTGDKKEIATHVADILEIDEMYAELLPADKVSHVENILQDKGESKVAFVGDGINDAPVLARADIGVAMGALGSDAAIEAADVVLMDDNPVGIAQAIKIARKTVKIVKQNIVFALGVKALILVLAAAGIATMWAAVFADVGVSFIAIMNALRTMRTE